MNNGTMAVTLPVLSIKRTVLFPGVMMTLDGWACTVDCRSRGGDEN